MKKKILSMLMCICVAFGCLFSFAGCSIIKEQNVSDGEQIILTVDGKEINKEQVVNNFYSFIYKNYALLYNGTASSVVEDMFYNDLVKNQIVMTKAEEAFEEGVISYCEEDEKDVWESVEAYFRSQIDSYEKDLYDNDESKYPAWLLTKDNSEEDEFFESYTPPYEKEDEDKGEKVQKLSREDIITLDSNGNSKFKEVFAAMFNYISSVEEDADGEEINIYTQIKDQDGAQTRRQAYANYIENLFLNAKAEGKQTTEQELLLDLIYEIYESYYEAKVTEIFQRYCEEVLVLDAVELKKESVVKMFIDSLNADKQNFLNEADYVSVITGKETELILYHNNDKFFTVQHILLKFDDELVNKIKEDPYYVDMSSKDVQLEYYEQFMKNREEIVENYYPTGAGALTDLNEEQAEKLPSLIIEGYYNYYTYSKADGYKMVNAGTEGAKKMSTIEQIINCYNHNLNYVVMPALEAVLMDESYLSEQNEDLKYMLEAAIKMQKVGKTNEEIVEKLSSLLFIELSWIFSDDGLYNTIYKQLGYVMANYPDDNNNFSHEFVDLAKTIFDAVKSGTTDMTNVSFTENVVMTKDGVHIIKLDNIFEQGESLIDVSGVDLTDTEAVANIMKQTYICNGSTQTIYDYYYDLIYSNLAGDDSANGSYFENLKNEWLQEYLNGNKVSYESKISYEELMSSMY